MAAENGAHVFGMVGANHPCRLVGVTGVGEPRAPPRRLDRRRRRPTSVMRRPGCEPSVVTCSLLPMWFGVVASPNDAELARLTPASCLIAAI